MIREKRTTTSESLTPELPPEGFVGCPAKTFDTYDGRKQLGRNVFDHCQIVGEVAKELVRCSPVHYLFPSGSALVAACHDIGKVSPTFYKKLNFVCDKDVLPNVNFSLEKQWGGHAGVSQLTAQELDLPDYIPEILGQHHGFAPDVSGMRARDERFGGLAWQAERERLVQALKKALDEDWPDIEDYSIARLLAGLTSVADWIGSGRLFDDPEQDWQAKIAQAVAEAGFVRPVYQKRLSFSDVFKFEARETQHLLFEQVVGPGVYVLEAPMGIGKTEAALYAAYQLLQNGQASGIYFALPTQLTSNKIFERFNHFLSRILDSECRHCSGLMEPDTLISDNICRQSRCHYDSETY